MHDLVTFNSWYTLLRSLEPLLTSPKGNCLCRQAVESTIIDVAQEIGDHGRAQLFVFTNQVPQWEKQSVKQMLNRLSDLDVSVTVLVFSRPGEPNWSGPISQTPSTFNVMRLAYSDAPRISRLIGLLTSFHDDLLQKKVLPMGNTTTSLLLNNQYGSLHFTLLGRLDSIAVETEDGKSVTFSSTSVNWTYGYVGLISDILIPGMYVVRVTTRSRATTLIVRGQFRSRAPRFCDVIDDVCLNSSRYFSPVKGWHIQCNLSPLVSFVIVARYSLLRGCVPDNCKQDIREPPSATSLR